MQYFKDTKFEFGQYYGLTIQQVYQGTLSIDKTFVIQYLDKVLNNWKDEFQLLPEKEFIRNFEIDDTRIIIHGDLHDYDQPYSKENSCYFGNIQQKLTYFLNNHFELNWVGILLSVRDLNRNSEFKIQLGADPEYIKWCISNVKDFILDEKTMDFLSNLPIAKWSGFDLLYIGNETYEYRPRIEIEYFQHLKVESDVEGQIISK